MTDDLQHAVNQQPARARKKRAGPIRVAPPAVVLMTCHDHEQAVTAMATMIASWWRDHQHDSDP